MSLKILRAFIGLADTDFSGFLQIMGNRNFLLLKCEDKRPGQKTRSNGQVRCGNDSLARIHWLAEKGVMAMKIGWNAQHPDQAIVVIDQKKLVKDYPQLMERTLLFKDDHSFNYSKVMYFQGELSGTFAIPKKEHPIQDRMTFGFILDDQCLYFIRDKGDLDGLVEDFMNEFDLTVSSAFDFLVLFMNYMIQTDVYYLEDYNSRLEDIEEDLYNGHSLGLEQMVMMARKDMNILGGYYLQLTAVAQTMQEIIIEKDRSLVNSMLSLFISRCSQLLTMVDNVKDNTSQIWNLRQTQLSDKQNKISTLLTVVTTLFTPLTLITGWFGMNFRYMPLLRQSWGYPVIICVCLIILFIEIRFIQSKHWLSYSKKDRPSELREMKARRKQKALDKFTRENPDLPGH